jgi:hypothetical protein
LDVKICRKQNIYSRFNAGISCLHSIQDLFILQFAIHKYKD